MIYTLVVNFYIVFILIYFIFVININVENENFKYKLNNINVKFYKNYILLRNCFMKKYLLDCIFKNNSSNLFKPYTENDIPGPFPYEYSFLEHTNNICKKDIYILVSVISLCHEIEERIAIRNVYKNLNSSIQIHFFIGYTSHECQKIYILEKEFFKDISQIPIKESYTNQTLFTLYLHKILPTICPFAKYYGKMDVDQYINYPKLINLLKINNNNKNIIYSCNIWRFKFFSTDQNNKYSSPKIIENYYKKVFPKNGINGFTGSFTLYPSFLSKTLYKESLNENHIIRMEDQHIAWLIHRLNMKRMNISFHNLKCYDARKNNNSCLYPYKREYGIHRIKGSDLYSFYTYLIKEK